MRTFLSGSVFLILIMSLFTLNTDLVKADDANDISSVLPEVYVAYRQQITGQYTIEDCNALFGLLEKAKVMRDEPMEDAKAKEARNRAYCAAWRLALHMRQHSKYPAVQNRVVEEWNKALRKDDQAVPYQIYAIPDRSLFTDDFWGLFKRTTRKKTISSISCMVYGLGTLADIEPLEQKRRSGIDVENQQTIQNAINHLKYRLSGDKTRGMPAAHPPLMDMKDDTQTGGKTRRTGEFAAIDSYAAMIRRSGISMRYIVPRLVDRA